MSRINFRILFLFVFVLTLALSSFSSVFPQSETITLTTYYPSPVGVFRELRAQRTAIGPTYYDSSQYFWDDGVDPFEDNEINNNTNLIVEGRTGIGTHTPRSLMELDSNGTANVYGGSVLLVGDSSEVGDGDGWARGIGLFREDKEYGRLGIRGKGADGGPGFQRFYISTNPDSATPWNDGHFVIDETGNVGMGTNTPQAQLDVSSTTSGFLPPRMTTSQRDNISSPADGMTFYNTTTDRLETYTALGWRAVGGGGGRCDFEGTWSYNDDGDANDFAITCRNGVITGWCANNTTVPRGPHPGVYACE